MQTVVNNRTQLASGDKQGGTRLPNFRGGEGGSTTLSHSSLHNSVAAGKFAMKNSAINNSVSNDQIPTFSGGGEIVDAHRVARAGSLGMVNFNKGDGERGVTTQKKAPFAYKGKRNRRDTKEVLTPGGGGALRNNLQSNFGVEGSSVTRTNAMVFTERLLVPFKGKKFSSVERQAIR